VAAAVLLRPAPGSCRPAVGTVLLGWRGVSAGVASLSPALIPLAVYGIVPSMVSPSEVVKSVAMSVPLPPLKRSAPEPPVSRSLPLPPPRLSSPRPPVRVSLPLSPHRTSFPSSPLSVSLLLWAK
jgi:hypothetical protein